MAAPENRGMSDQASNGKRIEDALRESDARHAYLLELADRIRFLDEPLAIQTAATELLAEHFEAARSHYTEIDDERNVGVIRAVAIRTSAPDVRGVYDLNHWKGPIDALRAGQPLVLNDWNDVEVSEHAAGDLAALRVRSQVAVPLVKNGRLVALLNLNDTRPRHWTDADVGLITETAERTWAAVQRAQAEAALRESEEKYRSLVEAMGEGYVFGELVRDAEGRAVDARLLEMNAAWERLVGSPRGESVGKLRSQVIAVPSSEGLGHIAEAIAEGRVVHYEAYAPSLGRWYEGRVHPRGGDRFAIFYDDISERKRAEQARRDDEEHSRYLLALADRLRSLDDPVTVGETATRLLCEQLGASRCLYTACDDDRGVTEVVAEYRREGVPSAKGTLRMADQETLLRDFRAGRPSIVDDRRKETGEESGATAGPRRTVRCAAVPVIKNDRLVGALIVDDTEPRRWTESEIALVAETAERTWAAIERVRVEAALRESEQAARALLEEATLARAQAEIASRAKDDFVATLSHELRTPLAAIVLWARILRSGSVPATDVARAIEAITESADSQARLIDDLLDLSRLTSGRLELAVVPTDVARAVEAAAGMVKPFAAAKSIVLSTIVERDVGVAMIDDTRIKQVLWNLLVNAVKFTPDGGAVTVRALRRGTALELEVVDEGEGISPDFLPHVFEKFRQADTGETRRHSGLGIGLALAKQLVELHKGSIEAESAGRGRGATFRVRLPFIEPPVRAHADGGQADAPASLGGARVMVVDDDVNIRNAMQCTLEGAGARVDSFATAAEALTAIETGSPIDVIVSDLDMPGMNGIELIERVVRLYERRGRPPPPSCAVSALARDVDRRNAIDAGFDMHIAKPTTPERLIEAVADLRQIPVG